MSFLGDLIVRLKAETADFTSDMGKAGRDGERAFNQLQSAAAKLGATLSAGAFVAMVKNAIDGADKLNDLSRSTQVAALEIGGIGYAAQQSGGSLEGAAKSFSKLNQAIAAARGGNLEMAATFKNVGISLDDLRRLSPEQVMFRLADVFSSVGDDANKAGYAAKFFGKSYADILPTLDEGADKLQKNIQYFRDYSGLTDDMVRRSDEFNDEVTKLKLLASSFATVLAAELLPVLKKLVDEMVNFKEKGSVAKEVAVLILDVFKSLAVLGLNVQFVFDTVGKDIARMVENLKLIAKGDFAGSRALGAMFAEDARKARQELDRRIDVILKLKTAAQGGGGVAPARGGAFDEGGAAFLLTKRSLPNLPKDAQHQLQIQKQQAAAIQEMENKRKALFHTTEEALIRERLYGREVDIGDGKLRKFKGTYEEFEPAVKKYLVSQAKEIDARRNQLLVSDLVSKSYEEMYDRLTRLREASDQARIADQQMVDAMRQQVDTIGLSARAQEINNFKFQEQVKLQERLRQIANTAGDDMAQYDKGRAEAIQQHDETVQRGVQIIQERQEKERSWMTGATKAMQEYRDAADDQATQMHDLFSHAFQGMEDALVNFVKTGKLDFKSLADSIIADIIRIQIRAQLAKLFGDPSNGGGILEMLGKAIFSGGSSGGAESVEYGVARARGGRVNPGGSYWVGEEGPEPFIPDVAGTIVSRDSLVSGGRSGPNVMIDARGADAAQVQRLEQMVLALHGSFERRAVAANLNAARRGA